MTMTGPTGALSVKLPLLAATVSGPDPSPEWHWQPKAGLTRTGPGRSASVDSAVTVADPAGASLQLQMQRSWGLRLGGAPRPGFARAAPPAQGVEGGPLRQLGG